MQTIKYINIVTHIKYVLTTEDNTASAFDIVGEIFEYEIKQAGRVHVEVEHIH